MNVFGRRARDRVLVVGGATVLGSRLVERFALRRLHAIAVDDLRSGSIANLARALETGNVTFVYARDLGDPDVVRAALEKARCNAAAVVHHCAGSANAGVSIEIATEFGARVAVAVDEIDFNSLTYEKAGASAVSIHGLYGPGVCDVPKVRAMFEAASHRLPIPAARGATLPALTYLDDAASAMLAATDCVEHGTFDVAAERNVLEADVARSLAAISGAPILYDADAGAEFAAARAWMPSFPEPRGWIPQVSLHDGLRRTWRALAAEPSYAR